MGLVPPFMAPRDPSNPARIILCQYTHLITLMIRKDLMNDVVTNWSTSISQVGEIKRG